MKKGGFTLIELIAVIIILGIISLLTVPKVIDSIDNSQLAAAEESAKNYIRAVNYYLMENELEEVDKSNQSIDYNISDFDIKAEGVKPTSGIFNVKDGTVIKYALIIDDVKINYENGNISSSFVEQ